MLEALAGTTSEQQRTFDAGAMQTRLDGRYAEVRNRIREVMCRPEFAPVEALPTPEYREQVLQWAKALAN